MSTNGPFSLQSTSDPLHTVLFLSPLHDELVGALRVARLVALGRHAPRRHRVPAARGLAFAAAERMVDRVHRHAAHVRPLAQPAASAGLADRHVLVIEIADLADRRVALDVDLPRSRPTASSPRRSSPSLATTWTRRPRAARDLAAACPAAARRCASACRAECSSAAGVARQDVDVVARHDRRRRPPARSAAGCSASRRRRRSAARSAPSGSGRTRRSPPSPECRACRA